jgi:hypothetical protein
MKETLIDSNDFRWSSTDLSNSYASSGYSGWIVRTDSIGDPQNTGEGSYEPMAIKVEGPEPLIATISQVEIFGHSLKVVANPDDGDYYVASEMDPSRPATLTVVNSPRVDLAELQLPDYTEPVPGFVEEPGDGAKLSDMKHMMDFFDRDMDNVVTAADFQNFLLQRAIASVKIVSSLDFYKGILAGLYGNPADSAADLCGLAKGAVKVATLTHPLRAFYEFTFGDRYEGEIAAAKRSWDATVGWATEVASFIASYYARGEAALIAAITQGIALPGTEKMSMFAKVAIDTIFMLLIAGEEAWDKLSNYNKGYGVGYVCAEIIISGVAALITAEVGGAGALVTLGRHSPKLLKIFHLIRPAITKLKLALSEFGDVAALLNKFIDKLTLAKVQKWCFIAGTPVMTMAGPLPIEQIHPGMMVWCAPEDGQGTGCFSPVLETYQNRAPEVWRIAYDHDRNATTPDATLTASAGHPVWVEERHEFVPTKDLQPGEHLRLAAGGGTVPVSSLTRQSAPPGGIPVFNLAVAEHHTYFAGKGGVWVHNLCAETFERFGSKFDVVLEKQLEKGISHEDAWKNALDSILQTLNKDKELKWLEKNEIMGYIAKHSDPPMALWNKVLETKRGEYIEAALAKQDYTDWGHIAQTDRWWPVVDFIKDQDVISVKSCDTRQASDFVAKLIKDAEKLRDMNMTNNNIPIAKKILDIRVQPGGSTHPGLQEVKTLAESYGLEVKIAEFP